MPRDTFGRRTFDFLIQSQPPYRLRLGICYGTGPERGQPLRVLEKNFIESSHGGERAGSCTDDRDGECRSRSLA